MALSISAQVQNILKAWYSDKVENLLFRNDPAIKMIEKVRVEGKEQKFPAIYGTGGAVSSSFTKAKAQAAETVRNAEFTVAPGALFSVYSMNSFEVQSSLTKRGAYMKVAGNKMFAATEANRRMLAAAFYGDGFGNVGFYTVGGSNETVSTSGTELTMTDPSIAMKLDIGSKVIFMANAHNADTGTVCEVTKIDGNKITFKGASSVTLTASTTYAIRIEGGCLANNEPRFPMGLAGWLPTASRGTTFCGVDRSAAPDRLAGAFVDDSATQGATKKGTLLKLLRQVRRQGSAADLIILNDEDWADLSESLATTDSYLTQTATKGKRVINGGVSELTAAFSTNYVENIVDSPYCPKGIFYILDKSAVQFWSYTNADHIDNGVAGNEAGKQDPMTMDADGHANDPAQLIIDDYINVQPGSGDNDGPNVLVTLQIYGSFVVTNPSVCGVGKFHA